MRKIYLLAIIAIWAFSVSAADKKVLVVSENDPTADATIQTLLDSIDEMDGYKAEHKLMSVYATMTAADYGAYAVALITENGSSGSMTNIGDVAWPIPCVHFKAYSLYKGNNPLFTQTATNWTEAAKISVYDSTYGQLVVLDNSDILKCYNVGDVVKWTTNFNTTGGSGEAHVQGFDLLSDDANAQVKANATALADNKYLAGQADAVSSFLWKIEENSYTKRTVCWGIHHMFMEFTTPDFYQIVRNAIKWVVKEDITCPGGGTIGINKTALEPSYNVYPNPLKDKLYISQAGSISQVEIIDVTGKVVSSYINSDLPVIEMNTSELVNGIYILRISDVKGNISSEKLIK